MFADASRQIDHGQLGCISASLFDELDKGSTFHVISLSSRKSRRPVKSIGAAEVLAVVEDIDERKILQGVMLPGIEIDFIVVLDSKDLFDTLSTCRNTTGRSVRADISVIPIEFETCVVSRMIWTPGKTNLADPLSKRISQIIFPIF